MVTIIYHFTERWLCREVIYEKDFVIRIEGCVFDFYIRKAITWLMDDRTRKKRYSYYQKTISHQNLSNK